MKAIKIHKQGGPEVIQDEDVTLDAPERSEVRLRHTAIGLNYLDTYRRSGEYPLPLPSGLGFEAAGVVEASDEAQQANSADLFEVVGSGAVKIELKQTGALADTAKAHQDLEERKTTGAEGLTDFWPFATGSTFLMRPIRYNGRSSLKTTSLILD